MQRLLSRCSLNFCGWSHSVRIGSPAYHAVVSHQHNLKDGARTVDKKEFAVVELMGKQFKVAPDDVIVADKIEDMDIGETFDIEDVLLVGSEMDTVIGRPYVPGVRVIAEVEEQTKDRKVIAFKMRRRKNSKRLKGFRRQVSILRILEIYRSGEHFENK